MHIGFPDAGISEGQSTFSITYVENGGKDDNGAPCITFPNEAKIVFNAAVANWGTLLKSSVPITIKACWSVLDEDTLGYSFVGGYRRNFSNTPRANTWFPNALANSIAGYDLDPSDYDMHITYNNDFDWYFGTDGNTPSSHTT
jgi:hypothetical protein